ncbi:cytochrome P450 [Streptomyces sp. NPDC046203]|uniref:cytochrome P450 n=1 Tax=Streptomyces sp. NPDC046203 TaxID=3154602 RepID=UPI0033C430F1
MATTTDTTTAAASGGGAAPAIPKVPGALPLLGHLRQLLTDPTGFLNSLPAHGDLVEIRLGPRRTYVVCTPELVAPVLLTGRQEFDKGGPFFENIAVFFGDGLATCPHAKHPRLRRFTQPAFHPHKLVDYAELAGREIEAVTAAWREGEVLDVYRVMQELALRITVSTMFASWFSEEDTADGGAEASAEGAGAVGGAGTAGEGAPAMGGTGAEERIRDTLRDVDTLVSGAFLRMVAPGIRHVPLLPTNRRYEKARRSFYARIDATIAAYRSDGRDRGDLLSMLLTPDEEGASLTDTEVREQVMTMFIAGIGTTAAMLSWSLHHLAVHPELDAAVAAEARAVRGGATTRHEQLSRLTTLSHVVTESFRITPAAWLFSRTTIHDTELGGHRVPAGADILISPYLLHHRPDLFPDPERFDPERWSGDPQSWVKAERALTMIPFGTGFRKCVGRDFSVNNITLALATMLADWRLTPEDATPVTISGRSIIEPRNLRLRVRARPAAETGRESRAGDGAGAGAVAKAAAGDGTCPRAGSATGTDASASGTADEGSGTATGSVREDGTAAMEEAR